jgi:uncharacterized membrane protein
MARSQRDKNAGTYAQEAMSEWGKAVHYGARALAAKRREGGNDRPPLKERLNPSKTDKGGRVGDAGDWALSKFGIGGKLASKVSLASRILERIRGGRGADDEGEGSDADGFAGGVPIPIQESIDVAVPVGAAFALCTRFAEYPEFLDRVTDVEEIDDSHVAFVAELRGRKRELEVELQDERPNERLDWECAEDIEHSGVISFHPLAPRLTRVELTIELEPHGLLERLARRAHLTERAIRDEMHRFKAYAELWEYDSEEEEPEDSGEPQDEEPQDQEASNLVDEEDLEDEENLEDEDFDEDELDEEELEEEELQEEELEPAGSGR